MIRFVDIRDQGTGYRFAFFDTVRDEFVKIGGDQVWDDKSDLLDSLESDPSIDKSRFIGLMPKWAIESKSSSVNMNEE